MNSRVNNRVAGLPRLVGGGAPTAVDDSLPLTVAPTRKAWSHERSRDGKDEWLTPPGLLSALGPFDLDPCAPVRRPWPTARHHLTVSDDGLTQPWHGRVWLNPPYGTQTGRWLIRLATHGNGIALIFARTETRMFFTCVWEHADAILFLRGRLTFFNVDGTPAAHSGGAPSCLVAFGRHNVQALSKSGLPGSLVHTWKLKHGEAL